MVAYKPILFVALVSGTILASPAGAQRVAPAPPPPGTEPAIKVAPGVPDIMRRQGISEAEARAVLDRQGEISRFLAESPLTQRPDFVDLVVRPKPYQIILTFERDVALPEVIEQVPASLRRYVKVRKAKHEKSKRSADLARLTGAFAGVSKAFAVGYDSDAETFFVDTDGAATTAKLRAAVPADLAAEVTFETGALPREQVNTNAVPTGVRSGDWAVAGWGTYTVGTNQPCTLAFPITFNTGLEGILTASHCTEPKYVPRPTHNYTFQDVYYESPRTGNYDFAIYRTDGLLTDYRLYYSNIRSTPGYGAEDWLTVKNFIRRASQWVGMYACKSGTETGLTCATVQSITYDWRQTGSSVFVRMTSDRQISAGGDSGAPVFVTLDSSRPSEITAAGIHTGGWGATTQNGVYVSVYMPIDRIFESYSSTVTNVRLKTAP